MKILHVFNQPRGGGGSLASTLATIDITRRHGHEVAVFTRNSRDIRETLTGKIETALGAFHSPRSEREFRAELDRFNPDIVHANELFPLISSRVLRIAHEQGIPVIVTTDDYHFTCPNRNHFRDAKVCTECLGGREHRAVVNNCKGDLAESAVNALWNFRLRRSRMLSECVDYFITCSEFTRQWLVKYADIEENRISAIPHAIEIPEHPVDAAGGEYAAFGGRFVPEKGIDVLLEAATICSVPVKLSRNEHHQVSIDIPRDVDVVVTQGRDDLADFYRGARLLAFPSSWFETYGVVGAESMSHGVPVVAARIGALENLVDDGVDGLLFEPGNARDLAEKMQILWDDPELASKMGQAGRKKAIERFSPQRNFADTLAVYKSVLGDSS